MWSNLLPYELAGKDYSLWKAPYCLPRIEVCAQGRGVLKVELSHNPLREWLKCNSYVFVSVTILDIPSRDFFLACAQLTAPKDLGHGNVCSLSRELAGVIN